MAVRRCASFIKKIARKRTHFVLYGFLFLKDGPGKFFFCFSLSKAATPSCFKPGEVPLNLFLAGHFAGPFKAACFPVQQCSLGESHHLHGQDFH